MQEEDLEMLSSSAAKKMRLTEDDCQMKREKTELRLMIDKLAAGNDERMTEKIRLEKEIALISLDQDHVSKFSGEFNIRKILGALKHKCVFEAESRVDRVKFAVKRLTVDASGDFDKELRQVRVLATLDHPGIVRYYYTWMEALPDGLQRSADGKLFKDHQLENFDMRYASNTSFIYIQMEFCKYSLEEWLQSNKLASSRVLHRMKSWFKQMVAAVAYLHEKSLIHGNIKTRNIMFAEDDILKLCDVQNRGKWDNYYYSSINSMMYTSPEQFNSSLNITSKTDIFSLGLIFSEMCTVLATDEAKKKVFDKYRDGQPNIVLDELPEVKEFVARLTSVKESNRPTCKEILANSFFRERSNFMVDDENSKKTTHEAAKDSTIRKIQRFHSVPENGAGTFSIPEKYKNYRPVGRAAGTLGYVIIFNNPDDLSSIAVKKFTHPFESENRSNLVLRELNLLRTIKHENIMKLLGCYSMEDDANSLESIYHITEYCGDPLEKFILRGHYSMDDVKKWTREMLRGIQHLHSNGIIHRDLQSENMCIDVNNKLTLIGFGKDRVLGEPAYTMTASRTESRCSSFELLVNLNEPYSEKVDIWSVSTILYEMISGKGLFDDSTGHTLKRQMHFCGPIEPDVLAKIDVITANQLRQFQQNKMFKRANFVEVLVSAMETGRRIGGSDVESDKQSLFDFFENTLQFNPERRLSTDKALSHPLLRTSHPWEQKLPVDNERATKEVKVRIWEEIAAASIFD